MVQRQEFLNSLSDNEVSASLAACFLEDKLDYSPEEVALFQECRSLIEAGCTYEEVSKHFSNKNSTTPVIEESTATPKTRKSKSKKDEPEKEPLDISSDVGAITLASETELANLVDKITDKLVEKIPPGLVKQMYVQKAVAKLAESPEEIHEFFVQLEDKIMGQLEGKSPMQMMLERGRTKLLPHSSTKSIQLPPESENDTNIS